MRFYSKTDIGKKRYSNQDAVAGKIISNNLAWMVVCDGMGGNNGGDIASKIAIEVISKNISDYLRENQNSEYIIGLMKESVELASKAIFDESKKDEDLKGMGTTVVLGVINNNCLYVVHAGDSRAYLIRNAKIEQISTDHSMVQHMVEMGEITAEEARNHSQKNIITKALGVESNVNPDHSIIELNDKDIILLCTDGLSNHLEDDEICKMFSKYSLEELPDILINKCNARGGKDNITVSLIEYKS